MDWIFLARDNDVCELDFLDDDYSRIWAGFIWLTIMEECGLDIFGSR